MIFTNKWIYYALSILVATIAAFESTRLLLLLGFLVLWLIYKKMHVIHLMVLPFVGLCMYYYVSFELQKLNEPLALPTTLTWTDEYKINGATIRGFMKDERGRTIYVAYNLKSEEEKNTFENTPLVGKQFFVEGTLEKTDFPAHQYAFDMDDYLKSKGAIGIVEISHLDYLKTKSSIPQKISIQRFKLKQHIEEHFPQTLVAEAQSLLIGLQENVDRDTTRAYQKLGITHIFAISGLHVAIMSFLFYQGLLRLRVRREFATIVLIVLLPVYAILAGGAPSVWRAVSVVVFLLITRLKWHIPINDALAISFIGFVLLEPWVIYQIGFQLSYLATVSLIYSSRLLTSFKTWWMQSLLITFVSQLIVYPLLLLHFYELSISSFIMNIFFVPLFSFIVLPMNILLLISSFIPGPIANILFLIYEPCRVLLGDAIIFLQSIPYQMWTPGKPTFFLILLMYCSVFFTFYLMDIRAKIIKILFVLFIPIVVVQFSGKLYTDVKISFINVGQGDCILVELPFQKGVYLIDSGGLLRFEQEEWKQRNEQYEVGRQVVVPYLRGKGIGAIDTLIITHADADHVEGAEEILQEIRVKEIHITPNSYNKEIMNDLLVEAKRQNVPIIEQIAGNWWKNGGVTFQYIWPSETEYEGNNDSLVLLMTAGNFTSLFTGDLEEEGELALVKRYPQLKNIDLLKAGHHGSKTSSSESFVQQLHPTLTIFNAGKDNRYGHPHEEVVERFHTRGLKTLTTGEVGTIEIQLRENGMFINTSNQYFEQKKKALSK